MIRSTAWDYIFVLRPMLFFPGWSTLLAGYLIPYRQQVWLNVSDILKFDYTRIILILLSFAASMGACFLLNQLKDIEGDLKNNKLFIISQGYITKGAARIELVILILLALILSILINLPAFYITMIFILLTGYLYNFKPFALKDVPAGSVAANAAMGGLAFALGWVLHSTPSLKLVVDVLPYLFLNTALYFNTTLPDIEGDRASQKKTLAVVLGPKRIITISFLLFILSTLSAIYLVDYQILMVLFLAAPMFIKSIVNRRIDSSVKTTKFTILFLSLMVCLKIPFYFILMLSGFFVTRLYFKHRFNFDYPNFKGK